MRATASHTHSVMLLSSDNTAVGCFLISRLPSNCAKPQLSQDTAGYNNIHLDFLGRAWMSSALQAGRIHEIKSFLFSSDCKDNRWKVTKSRNFPATSLSSLASQPRQSHEPPSVSQHQTFYWTERTARINSHPPLCVSCVFHLKQHMWYILQWEI